MPKFIRGASISTTIPPSNAIAFCEENPIPSLLKPISSCFLAFNNILSDDIKI